MVSHCKLKIIQEEILLPKVDFTIDGLLIDVESKGEKSDQVSYPESDTLLMDSLPIWYIWLSNSKQTQSKWEKLLFH